jgi:hypothetical protein
VVASLTNDFFVVSVGGEQEAVSVLAAPYSLPPLPNHDDIVPVLNLRWISILENDWGTMDLRVAPASLGSA